jgi:flagellar biosynthesis chaperone FliJ
MEYFTKKKIYVLFPKIAAFEKNKAGLAADFEITLTALGVEKEGLKEKYEAQVKKLMSEKENLMREKEKQKKEFNIKYSNLTKDSDKYKKQIKSTEKAQTELQEQLEKSQTEWQTRNAKRTKILIFLFHIERKRQL